MRTAATLVLFFASALIAIAQVDLDLDSIPHFAASDIRTLAGSGTKWTLAVPANTASRLYIVGVSITCEQACDLTQTQNSSAPTGTAVTNVIPLNLPTATSIATLYQSSDSTGGSSLDPIPVQANVPMSLGMKASFSRGQPTAQNYSFAVSGFTGKARIHIVWAQRGR
jgi:hypothetical protein